MRRSESRIGMTEIFHFSFEALTDRKVRSILTILMVVMGASLVTSLNGMTQGMDTFMKKQLSTLATNVVIVFPAPRSQHIGGPPPPPTMVMNEQTLQVFRSFGGVQTVIPFYRGSVTVISGGQSRSVIVMGIDQNKLPYVTPDISLQEGSYVGKLDPVGIIFGYQIAYPPGQTNPFVRVGQIVTLEFTHITSVGGQEKATTERRSFQVKGILNQLGNEFRDTLVYVSLPAANSFLKKAGKYNGAYVITNDADVNDVVEKSILQYFGANNIGVISPKDIAERVQSIQGGFRFFMTVVSVISLMVGAMGIVTTMFTSVVERTREIGVLKALGSNNKMVLLVFLFESAAIGILGGIIGIAAGSVMANSLIDRLPLQDFRVFRTGGAVLTPQDVAFTFGLSVLLSMGAGLYPAWRASKLDPVHALRSE